MNMGESGHQNRSHATEDQFFPRPQASDSLTPAQQAALEALVQEFRDLLATAR